MKSISKQQVKRFLLRHQCLLPPHQIKGKPGILQYIRNVGCIQFDPINIVGQNPDLVLQARVSDYRPAMLRELLYQERKLLDGWDKNMSIYAVEDWPYFKRRREADRKSLERRDSTIREILDHIRQELDERGPLSSIDLKIDGTVDWSWAPTRLARAALESMYFWGELIVHHKVNTRRVYDFAHRHLPQDLLEAPDPNLTEEQFQEWYVHRRIGSIGLLWSRAGDAWLGLMNIKTKQRQAIIQRLLEQERLLEIKVEGFEAPLYARKEDEELMAEATNASIPEPQAAIIAPLDNLLWDRRLLEALFDFNYRWEVYKPVEERTHGYYVLPVLYGDRFVARFEPGQEKKSKALIVKNWWWEPGVEITDQLLSNLFNCFQRFQAYLGAEKVLLEGRAAGRADLEWLA